MFLPPARITDPRRHAGPRRRCAAPSTQLVAAPLVSGPSTQARPRPLGELARAPDSGGTPAAADAREVLSTLAMAGLSASSLRDVTRILIAVQLACIISLDNHRTILYF